MHQDYLQLADGFREYLTEIHRIPLLTPDEETRLARRWRNDHDEEAARRLVVSNLRFVVKVAGEYKGYRIRLADLVQEGNIGLMRAVEKFDPDRGVRLISYAVWWIRAEIQSFILRGWSMVKFGTTRAQRRLFFGMWKARQEIQRLGVDDPDAEAQLLADQLGTTRGKVRSALRRMSERDVSLDAQATGDDRPLLSQLAAPEPAQDETVDRLHVRQEVAERLRGILPRLNERERFILEHRFLTDEPMLLREIADRYGISRERVRQLEGVLKRKLRAALSDLDPASPPPAPDARAS